MTAARILSRKNIGTVTIEAVVRVSQAIDLLSEKIGAVIVLVRSPLEVNERDY